MAFGAVVLLACLLPYLAVQLFGPPDLEHVGTFWFVRDFSQYQAAMREGGSSGSWLIHDRFTAEPHDPIFMYPLYVALGKLGAVSGLDDAALFQAAEWISRIVLLGSLYVFASTFAPQRDQRRLAMVLAVGTLGLAGWSLPLRMMSDATGNEALSHLLPSGVNVYLEMNSFGVFLSAPHLLLGLALTLLAAPIYLWAQTGGGRRRWLLGAVILGLALVHPFNLPVLLSVLLVDALARAISRREPDESADPPAGVRRWVRLLRAPLLAAIVALPIALYNLFLFQVEPFWSGTYGAQNLMPAPALWALPVDFGIVLLAAPIGWAVVRRDAPGRTRLLVLWVVLGFLWMYVPVPYQRRFGFGLQPALAVLSAIGVLAIRGALQQAGWSRVRRRVARDFVAVVVLATPMLVYVSILSSAVRNTPSEVYLWRRSEAEAAQWLASQTGEADVVLAPTPFANPLVGVFDGRVVHGHIVATRESDRKIAIVQRFYAADATIEERSALLRQTAATIVALSPREGELGARDLSTQPELSLIYDRGGVRWYRVARGEPS